MKLTNEQIKAINHKKSPALVLAAPGAGKTTMLLERIKKLSDIIDPSHILTLTFSKSQAVDMKLRYDYKPSNFMTIHAFSYLVIRAYLKENQKNLRLLEGDHTYNKYQLIRDLYYKKNNKLISNEDIDEYFRITGFMKNSMKDLSYLEKSNLKDIKDIYDLYENFKKENHYIDFDDMLTKCLEILEEDLSILRRVRSKYKFVQVDEGQDTSLIQFKIIEKIIYPSNNLMIVADDDQSIYSFRAAWPKYLLEFDKHYPNSSLYTLSINHRSSKNIVDLSARFISKNDFRYNKKISSSKRYDGNIKIIKSDSIYDSYSYIKKNLDPNKKNAILFRNNIHSLNIISFLMRDDLDFSLRLNSFDFFSSKISKDIFDIIKFADDFNDIETFLNIYYKINTYLKKEEVASLKLKPINKDIFEFFYDKNLSYDTVENLVKKEKQLKHIRKLSLDNKISYIYKYLGYKAYIENYSRKYREVLVNKELYIESMINFTKELYTLEEFKQKKERLNTYLKNDKANIILSTIHRAKGLEYDNVFVINLVKNEFPILRDDEPNIRERIEEERRIMYVAMTRAKENLTMMSIKKRNGRTLEESMFLKEVMNLKS